MTPIAESTFTNIALGEGAIQMRVQSTTIFSGPKKIFFSCRHCGTTFATTNYTRTPKKHYSASCPCCPYSVWTP